MDNYDLQGVENTSLLQTDSFTKTYYLTQGRKMFSNQKSKKGQSKTSTQKLEAAQTSTNNSNSRYNNIIETQNNQNATKCLLPPEGSILDCISLPKRNSQGTRQQQKEQSQSKRTLMRLQNQLKSSTSVLKNRLAFHQAKQTEPDLVHPSKIPNIGPNTAHGSSRKIQMIGNQTFYSSNSLLAKNVRGQSQIVNSKQTNLTFVQNNLDETQIPPTDSACNWTTSFEPLKLDGFQGPLLATTNSLYSTQYPMPNAKSVRSLTRNGAQKIDGQPLDQTIKFGGNLSSNLQQQIQQIHSQDRGDTFGLKEPKMMQRSSVDEALNGRGKANRSVERFEQNQKYSALDHINVNDQQFLQTSNNLFTKRANQTSNGNISLSDMKAEQTGRNKIATPQMTNQNSTRITGLSQKKSNRVAFFSKNEMNHFSTKEENQDFQQQDYIKHDQEIQKAQREVGNLKFMQNSLGLAIGDRGNCQRCRTVKFVNQDCRNVIKRTQQVEDFKDFNTILTEVSLNEYLCKIVPNLGKLIELISSEMSKKYSEKVNEMEQDFQKINRELIDLRKLQKDTDAAFQREKRFNQDVKKFIFESRFVHQDRKDDIDAILAEKPIQDLEDPNFEYSGVENALKDLSGELIETKLESQNLLDWSKEKVKQSLQNSTFHHHLEEIFKREETLQHIATRSVMHKHFKKGLDLPTPTMDRGVVTSDNMISKKYGYMTKQEKFDKELAKQKYKTVGAVQIENALLFQQKEILAQEVKDYEKIVKENRDRLLFFDGLDVEDIKRQQAKIQDIIYDRDDYKRKLIKVEEQKRRLKDDLKDAEETIKKYSEELELFANDYQKIYKETEYLRENLYTKSLAKEFKSLEISSSSLGEKLKEVMSQQDELIPKQNFIKKLKDNIKQIIQVLNAVIQAAIKVNEPIFLKGQRMDLFLRDHIEKAVAEENERVQNVCDKQIEEKLRLARIQFDEMSRNDNSQSSKEASELRNKMKKMSETIQKQRSQIESLKKETQKKESLLRNAQNMQQQSRELLEREKNSTYEASQMSIHKNSIIDSHKDSHFSNRKHSTESYESLAKKSQISAKKQNTIESQLSLQNQIPQSQEIIKNQGDSTKSIKVLQSSVIEMNTNLAQKEEDLPDEQIMVFDDQTESNYQEDGKTQQKFSKQQPTSEKPKNERKVVYDKMSARGKQESHTIRHSQVSKTLKKNSDSQSSLQKQSVATYGKQGKEFRPVLGENTRQNEALLMATSGHQGSNQLGDRETQITQDYRCEKCGHQGSSSRADSHSGLSSALKQHTIPQQPRYQNQIDAQQAQDFPEQNKSPQNQIVESKNSARKMQSKENEKGTSPLSKGENPVSSEYSFRERISDYPKIQAGSFRVHNNQHHAVIPKLQIGQNPSQYIDAYGIPQVSVINKTRQTVHQSNSYSPQRPNLTFQPKIQPINQKLQQSNSKETKQPSKSLFKPLGSMTKQKRELYQNTKAVQTDMVEWSQFAFQNVQKRDKCEQVDFQILTQSGASLYKNGRQHFVIPSCGGLITAGSSLQSSPQQQKPNNLQHSPNAKISKQNLQNVQDLPLRQFQAASMQKNQQQMQQQICNTNRKLNVDLQAVDRRSYEKGVGIAQNSADNEEQQAVLLQIQSFGRSKKNRQGGGAVEGFLSSKNNNMAT